VTAQYEEIIQFATLATRLAGVIFGILEMHRTRKARAGKAAIDVFSNTGQEALNDGHMLVLNLPPDASPDHIRNPPNLRRATELLTALCEDWGIMVICRIVRLRTPDLLVSGLVRGCWMRLYRYIESRRDGLSIAAFGEWLQWLPERLEQYPQPEKRTGAHIAFSTWKP
jgi:hypothetical protein